MPILLLGNSSLTLELKEKISKKLNINTEIFSDRFDLNNNLIKKSDFIISYNYRYIIDKKSLSIIEKDILNLHISLLPWNRCAYPNIWSFLDDTPKGVTIHLIDKGIDTGKILLQKQIEFDEEKETLKSSYDRLNNEIQELFINNWDSIKRGDLKSEEQTGTGSIHYKKDFEKIKHLVEPYGWDVPISLLKERYRKYLASL